MYPFYSERFFYAHLLIIVGSDESLAFTLPHVASYVKDLKNVRAFGLLLKISPARLDQIERSTSDRIPQIIHEWLMISGVMDDNYRWEELGRVLLAPAVCELKIASMIRPHFRRGSSVESAYLDGSFSTPPDCHYELSFIGELYNRNPCIHIIINFIQKALEEKLKNVQCQLHCTLL